MIHSFRVTSVTFRDIYKMASLVIMTDLLAEAIKMRTTVNGNAIMEKIKQFSQPQKRIMLHVLAFG